MVYWGNASVSARHHLDSSLMELWKTKPIRYLTHIIQYPFSNTWRHITDPHCKSINQFNEVSPLNELKSKFKRSSNKAVSKLNPASTGAPLSSTNGTNAFTNWSSRVAVGFCDIFVKISIAVVIDSVWFNVGFKTNPASSIKADWKAC